MSKIKREYVVFPDQVSKPSKQSVETLIETQVLLCLLVKKGIVTSQEISETRNAISSMPKYEKLLESVGAYGEYDTSEYDELMEAIRRE